MIKPTLVDLNLNKHNQGLRYYPLMVSLDRYNGICNTPDDFSSKICVLNFTNFCIDLFIRCM